MAAKKTRLLYFVSHPIQYQAPLLRYLGQCDSIDLHVLFREDLSSGTYHDDGFGCKVAWDTPLLDGYSYQFLFGKKRYGRYSLVKTLLTRDYDVFWVHGYATPSAWLAMIISKIKGAKILVRGESVNQFSHASPWKRFIRPLFFKLLNYLVDGYLSIGTENSKFYKAKGVPDEKLFSAPYTVDNNFFRQVSAACSSGREALRNTLGLESGRPIVLYASKMQARKHANDLLEAHIQLLSKRLLSSLPYLIFIGDGEMRESLEARVAENKLNSVRFLGFKNQSELPAYFDLCDVFVLPSARENWGLIVNEVMNAGRAVIVSDEVGCAPDLVESGVNGMIYPARDVDALTEALLQVLSDPERLKLMGKESLRRISRWGIPETAGGILSACSQLCK